MASVLQKNDVQFQRAVHAHSAHPLDVRGAAPVISVVYVAGAAFMRSRRSWAMEGRSG